MGRRRTLGVNAALWLLATYAWCVTPCGAETTARELLDRTRQLNETTRKWGDRVQHLKLAIIDRRGGERQRSVVIYFKKYPEDRNRTLLFFETPPEVKGVGFLQWANPRGQDEQWLYLPELKRVRQISGGAKRESFVGTDFSYDDLAIISQITDWTEAEAKSKLVREETVAGQPCYVVEFTPDNKDVGYSKIDVWLTRDDLVIVKFEMYDSQGRLEKVLTLSDIRPVGNVPTPYHMEMSNVQSGSRTVVDFSEVQYDSGLETERFTQRALERGM